MQPNLNYAEKRHAKKNVNSAIDKLFVQIQFVLNGKQQHFCFGQPTKSLPHRIGQKLNVAGQHVNVTFKR